jgi:S1-C subfamily serine protease
MGQYNKHAAAKKAGFLKDDVIVELAGVKTRSSEGAMIGHLLTERRIGQTVDVVVLRGKDRVALKLPMQ